MRAPSRSARTVMGALVAVVVVAGWALGGALPAAGQDAAASPALTVTAPKPDAVVRSAPTVVVRAREPVEGVTARLVRDGTTLAEARQTEPSDTGAYRVDLPARTLAAVANGPAKVQARAGDGDAWVGHDVVLDLDPLPTRVTAEAAGDAVEVAWAPVPLAPEGRYEVQRSTDGEHFEHLAARESRADISLRDPGRAPGTYHYRVVVTRPGADPGTRRQATSEAVAVVVPEPEPDPTPRPQAAAPPPQAAPQPSPQASPQPPPPPQPGSDADPSGQPAPSGRPAPGASAGDAGAPSAEPTEARGPGSRDVASAGPPPPNELAGSGAPRTSSSLPRLQSRTERAFEDMVASDDVAAPQVAPRATDRDAAPGRDVAGGPQAAPPAGAARGGQDAAAEHATLDVASSGALPRPPLTPLVGAVVFAAALFALRRRV